MEMTIDDLYCVKLIYGNLSLALNLTLFLLIKSKIRIKSRINCLVNKILVNGK